ncbi:MAG: class I SAM-dependent methyltransferase, partial [Bdellovibrionota bacterium]
HCHVCGDGKLRSVDYPKAPNRVDPLGFERIETCESCGLGYATPRATQAQVDEFYSSGAYWEPKADIGMLVHHRVQAHERLKAVSRLAGSFAGSIRILDIGAGHAYIGSFAPLYFRGAPTEYSFVEPDSRLSEIVMKREPHLRFLRVGALAETCNNDIVFANQVMEHVSDPTEFFAELVAATKPGGLIYVEVPNRDDEFKSDVFPHTLFFSMSALSRLVACDGRVELVSIESFGDLAIAGPRTIKERLRLSIFNRGARWAERAGISSMAEWMNRKAVDYSVRERGLWLRVVARKLAH